jgi:hypothetical protein
MAKFGMKLNVQKTRLIEFGRFAATKRKSRGQPKPEMFNFLGFTHCCGSDKQGRFKLIRLTDKTRMRATLDVLRTQLMRRRHEPIAVVGRWLNRIIQGYFNYHGVPSLYRLARMHTEICRAWRHALMRRSQRHRLPWSRCSHIAKRFIPRLRNTHPYPEEQFSASPTREAPYAVIPHVQICAGGNLLPYRNHYCS